MPKTFVTYEHHGRQVHVRADLKGQHREHCLCFECAKLDLLDRDKSCPIANAIYRLCVLTGCVLPVWGCPEFQEMPPF